MSWFSRTKGRKALPAEKDIARECEKIKHTEEVGKKLLKEGKKLSDASQIVGRAGSKIGSDFSIVNSEGGEKCECAVIFEKAMDECDRLSHDKHYLIQKTLVEPMRRYTAAFVQLNAHIKGHEKAQQEYRKLQAKFDKMKEKESTGPNIVKANNLKKELAPVKDDFESKHSMLLDEFPAFYNNRLLYLQPIFESLIMSQCWYHHELGELFQSALSDITQNDPEQDLEGEVQDTLEQIRALSITKD